VTVIQPGESFPVVDGTKPWLKSPDESAGLGHRIRCPIKILDWSGTCLYEIKEVFYLPDSLTPLSGSMSPRRTTLGLR
jgi:hypothetical protein